MEYSQHLFYTSGLIVTPEQREAICRDAKSKCYDWWVDHMPSWSRKRIQMDFDEVLKYLYEESIHFFVIHRRGYPQKDEGDWWGKWHLEIGFSTLARSKKLPTTEIPIQGDLYLWIKLDEKHLPYFIEKYGLKIR